MGEEVEDFRLELTPEAQRQFDIATERLRRMQREDRPPCEERSSNT